MIYDLIRPLVFNFDPEQAHGLTLKTLARAEKCGVLPCVNPHTQPTTLMGLALPNPIGLAAGMDKNGECIDGLAALGFGFIEIGTVTPRPQAGNPKPRLFRSPEHQAIINRMGFNNDGIDQMIRNIARSQYRGVLGINIGKNATTPIENATDDYLICLEKAYAHASYITVNISSPNTQNLRSLQGGDELSKLLTALKNKQAALATQHSRYVPLAVKIAPDLDEAQIADIAHVALQTEMDGIIATNTTIDKSALGASPLAQEAGGLSGAPVREPSNRVLKALAQELASKVPIIGAGGVLSGKDAAEKIQLGATAVQIYSGMVYRGPELVKECLTAVQAASV
ncbi:quinone-dependent dihydroorotate dehydrogenase [Kingella kingae]|uniref:quinone-dependent dihydroorotate dehydrogenase n=1 Tax=Kingella kingae TaxID=504 RepID=UPI00041BE05F|nr:quinone-dependent dihydroorotate dehydrogenase [Kingella kingae]MDK4592281.1 quinone-dependent dihydroorotate dehydrogenase [Kingella kingae]MDK4594449.1 quinone-dependent dihydroorotate dehydrogenase [Kingella kingae]MDK4643943.1 quinone-dependent dihydroorotate dehydrogenase [Kingella kingae]MDK4661816.1 quinone-dependent dihydroorotate dehydrogenase [Kingella kingae]MDK4663755.1 quinone-dependent dihydroorotate dehydrogenase [Kingella kingae]